MGKVLEEEVEGAIRGAKNFVALVCFDFIQSKWAKNEVTWFNKSRESFPPDERRLVTLMCENVEQDPRLDLRLGITYYGVLYRNDKNDGKVEILSDNELKKVIVQALTGGAARRRMPHDEFDPDVPPASWCVGRKAELDDIKAHFFPNQDGDRAAILAADPPAERRRVLIHAGPGFGKTTLAARFARENELFFSGVWWIRSENRDSLLRDLAKVSPEQKDRKKNKTELASLEDARDLLDSRFSGMEVPFLLVFDNATVGTKGNVEKAAGTIDDETLVGTKDLVQELVQNLPKNVRVLITSRVKWADWSADDAKALNLDALNIDVAANYLIERAGKKSFQEQITEARSLAIALGGLPLALSQAAACCNKTNLPFEEYEQEIASRLREENLQDKEYRGGTISATVTMNLRQAELIVGKPARSLANFLSYCAAERIPRSLYVQALDSKRDVDAAVEALTDFSLVSDAEGFAREPALSMHRLTQKIIRGEVEKAGQSAQVISRLMPFLCEQLTKLDAKDANEKYFPHLLQALPHLNGPAFRGSDKSDLLDDVAKLVVLALKREYELADDAYPEGLPALLACSYEVDPLDEPLTFVLERLRGRQAKDWEKFRDECLESQNYVLRFALAKALAAAAEDGKPPLDFNEVTRLLENPKTLNHFELGGYALKDLYSTADAADIDPDLLDLLARHPCYPGPSILCDLLLNLAHRKPARMASNQT